MTPCILFEGTISDQGYGRIYVGKGRSRNAHAVLWERKRGPIPAGKQLDHLCRVRACVNLDHLEPVTPKENVLRGDGPTARNARKVQCSHGHGLIGRNLYIDYRGRRRCRTCQRALADAYKNKNRARVNARDRAYRAERKAALSAQETA